MLGIKSEALLSFVRYITSKTPTTRTTMRNLCTKTVSNVTENHQKQDQNVEKPLKKPVRKKTKKSTRDLEKIYEYFKETDLASNINSLPSRIMTQRKSKPDHLYLFDAGIADDITKWIKDDLVDDSGNVIEVNAGIGTLTTKLLNAGLSTIRIMESSIKFIQVLAELQKNHGDKIVINEADLFNIWRIAHQDKQDEGGRVDKLFSEFPRIGWGDKLGIKIIGAITSVSFMNHVILDVVRQHGIVSCGRPCFYLAMPPSVWAVGNRRKLKLAAGC